MYISTIEPRNVDRLLEARLEQTRLNLENQYLDMNPQDPLEWERVLELKQEHANAMFAQQQNFVIQHHLAKTILSTT